MASAARADYYEEDGSLTKFTPALRKIGVLTLLGIGTAKNAAAAFQFIQEAAKYGDEPANILLGQMNVMRLKTTKGRPDARRACGKRMTRCSMI